MSLTDSELRSISDNLGIPIDSAVMALDYMIAEDIDHYVVSNMHESDRERCQFDQSKVIEGKIEYGGYKFIISYDTVKPANITIDPEYIVASFFRLNLDGDEIE